MMIKIIFLLMTVMFLASCSVFSSSSGSAGKGKSNPALARALGLSVLELPKNNSISLKVKFQCAQEGNKEADTYKIKMFQYKIKVSEGEKEIVVEGTQRAWLEPNVAVLNLNYPKTRNIVFKRLEISSHTWVRSFAELQLAEPLTLTLQECKDLAPY